MSGLLKTDFRFAIRKQFAAHHFPREPFFPQSGLLKTDFRFAIRKQFAAQHFPEDPSLFQTRERLFRGHPGGFQSPGQVDSPWPSIYALFGICSQHNGLGQEDCYMAMFTISRSLGCMSYPLWYRIVGLPIKRVRSPNSWAHGDSSHEDVETGAMTRLSSCVDASRILAPLRGASRSFWKHRDAYRILAKHGGASRSLAELSQSCRFRV